MKLKTNIKSGEGDFFRTGKSISSGRFSLILILILISLVLLGAWTMWFLLARITLYETTENAHLEVDQAVHPIEAPVEGRVVALKMELGQQVKIGEIVAELENIGLKHKLEEERARRASLVPQIEALRREVSAEEQALAQSRRAAGAEIEEAEAKFREADATANLAETEAEQRKNLFERNVISETEMLRAETEAKRERAGAESVRASIERLKSKLKMDENDRKANINHLLSEIKELEGIILTSPHEQLEYQIEQRRIRSPVTGQIAEVSEIRKGTVVEKGERLGAILPPGALKIIADFSPHKALGRIFPGQIARLKLHGFPWAQYGSVSARVEKVAGEVGKTGVRVELSIEEDQDSPIPSQHGLPGTLEVAVEKVSPATLVLRAAGRLISNISSIK